MRDLISTIDTWRARGDHVALAIVVKTGGSTPRPLGAKMIINSRGEFAGSVSGGCVEGVVIEEAQRVLASGEPRLLHYGIADETAWDVGLSCGGAIDVFVQTLTPALTRPLKGGEKDEGYAELKHNIAGETLCAQATIIHGENLGTTMFVYPDGHVAGGLRNPKLQSRVVHDARAAMKLESPKHFTYDDTQVFIDIFAPQPKLIIIGAVHTAIPLTQFAQALGFHVTIVDARSRFATRERFPSADAILVMWADEALAQLKIDASTYVAILTHDPKFDLPALEALSKFNPRYIGAMGSRETRRQHFDALRARGIAEEFLVRIHGPIGLDVGAQSPEEIALAILAEIVAVRHHRAGGLLSAKVALD